MELKDRISEAIAGARDANDEPKSDAQIARDCKVTQAAVTQWKSGATQGLKANTALLLEQATGYRAFWILYGKGPKRVAEPLVIWPFGMVDRQRFESLAPGDKGYVERVFLQAVEVCEARPGGPQLVPPTPPSTDAQSGTPSKRGGGTKTPSENDESLTRRKAGNAKR